MKTTLSIFVLLGLTLAACSNTAPTPSVGGETNWLMRCSDDSTCDQGSCLCGVCARECSAERTCDGAFKGTCVATNSAAGEALCGAQKGAVPARVCLPRCAADADCGAGFDCNDAVCVPRVDAGTNPTPHDAGPDSTVPDTGVPDATSSEPDTGTAPGPVSDPRLVQSLATWNALVATMGDTYSYAEENCRAGVVGGDQSVTTIEVTNGVASLFGRTLIPGSECLAFVNRYDDFTPRTMPELYTWCDTLIGQSASAVKIELDDRGVIRGCTWPGDPGCQDNCGDGFYLRSLMFGTLEVP